MKPPLTIHLVIDGDGDVYSSATSYEIAATIREKAIEDGQLSNKAWISHPIRCYDNIEEV